MQMRNLLRIIGSLSLTTGAATSVVACGHPQVAINLDTVLKNKELGEIPVVDIAKPTEQELKDAIKAVSENKEINLDGIEVKVVVPEESGPIISAIVTPDGKIYNGDEITVTFTLVHKKTDVEVIDAIKATLEKGVDGSSLDSSQQQKDANDIIKAAIKEVTDANKVGEATFDFVNGETALTAGTNEVAITVTFGGSQGVAITVNLTGVTAHKKTDVEITDAIKATLEKDVDGSSLDNSQQQNDANDIIKAAIKEVTDANKVGEATFDFVNGETALTAGTNEVAITVTFGQSKDVAITVNLTGVTEYIS